MSNNTEEWNPLDIPYRAFDKRRGTTKGLEKIPCCIYFRVSTLMQDFDRQKKIVSDYIKGELGEKYYFPEGCQFLEKVSGQDANRPEYRRLKAALRAHQYKVVICASMDRFGRKLPELLASIEECRKYDVELRFIKDKIVINNEGNAAQMLIIQLLGAVAEFEVNLTRERVSDTISKKRENPFWWTGQHPKIIGEKWMAMCDMYYARKPRVMGLVMGKYRRKADATQPVYRFSLKAIGDTLGLSKGNVSDIISKYVAAGIMKHRSPKMVRKPKDIDYLNLPSYRKENMFQKTKKTGSHSILHPFYWPENIRNAVSKEFGDYASLSKDVDHAQTVAAWQFGKKAYYSWMKQYAANSKETGEIIESGMLDDELWWERSFPSDGPLGNISKLTSNPIDYKDAKKLVDDIEGAEDKE